MWSHVGWDEDGGLGTVVRRADPVLRSADRTGKTLSTADVGQQDLVDLAQQTPRYRKRVEPHETVLQRVDVVRHLADRALRFVAGLGVEDVGQRRLRALDAAARERLAGDVRLDQQVRVRQ